MTSPVPTKRSYDVADLPYPSLQNKHPETQSVTAQLSPPHGGNVNTFAQMPLLPSTETNAFGGSPFMPPTILPPASERPAKRSKPSHSEKEAKRIEREAKDRQRIEEKARKEIERAKRDAEKAIKEEERKKIKEAKDAQARLKEEEKQRREDEKTKKAKSQLRLNAFFQQHSNPDNSPTTPPTKPSITTTRPSPLSSRRSSITELNAVNSERRSRSVSAQATPSKPRPSDYQRYFPDFFLQSHTVIAPQNRFARTAASQLHAAEEIDEMFSKNNDERCGSSNGLVDLLQLLPKRRKKPYRAPSVEKVVDGMDGSSMSPIDLTENVLSKGNSKTALKNTTIKFLKFAEDVRPPYIGSYSKDPTRGSICSLARNPLARVRPDTNYDYDSEAEWEDPIDGEDLNSEGEEDEEDEDDEEMEGFLDDEEPNAIKRRPLLGDQEPICSGICWEGELHSSTGGPKPDLDSYRIDVLLENPCFPINPFSADYWMPSRLEKASSERLNGNQTTLMEPPRVPLSPIKGVNALLKPPPTNPITNKAPKAPKRFVDPDILEDFKQAIVGSDLTKMGLCEILKKRFPKQKKDAIKDTLDAVAERVGEKVADKRWALKNGV